MFFLRSFDRLRTTTVPMHWGGNKNRFHIFLMNSPPSVQGYFWLVIPDIYRTANSRNMDLLETVN